MDFYHSWVYMYLLNAKWFIWSILILTIGVNVFSPVLLWLLFSGRKIKWMKRG